MVDLDRAVRVSGLPTDMDDDRLSDKLLILFLRERHGGGEITSVIINKDGPGSAIITFEDSRVARRVILHGQHVLQIDGMQYELIVTPHCEHLEPDMVVLSMSVTIDCNQLLLRRTTKRVLLESYPGIRFKDNTSEKWCRITGPYSQVQAALVQLLGLTTCQKSEDTRSKFDHAFSDGLYQHAVTKSQSPEAQLSQPYNGSISIEPTYSDPTAGDYRSSPHGYEKTSSGLAGEDVDETETGAIALQLSNDPIMLDEDLCLVMDADIFQYLQKNCGKEYQCILGQCGIEVLDITSEGVTTLFLQCETKVGEVDSDLKRLKSARSQISQLYHDSETKICRVHLLKSTLPARDVLQMIIENLGVTLPKLLLNEDDQNIYLIGSYSDTSEAKKIIWEYNESRRVSHEIGSLLRSTSIDLNAYPFEGQSPSVVLPQITGALRGKTDTWLGLDKDENNANGATKYRIAAGFKHTGPGALVSLPEDFTGGGLELPSPAMQTVIGPMSGTDVLSGTGRFTDKCRSRQNTGEDVFFTLESAVRPSQISTLGDYEQKFSGSPPIPTQTSSSGSVKGPVLGTVLNCNSSSPETSIPKVQAAGHDTAHTGSAKYRVRERASLSHLKGKHRSELCSGKITVSKMIWEYIKEMYWSQLVELTMDIRIEEQQDVSDLTTVVLTALDSSKVTACQKDLQNLVAMVTADFFVYDLSLTELGVTDPKDNILEACCDEVQRKYKKISIHTSKELLSILGPQHLCSQVASMLTEVFSGASTQIPRQQQCFYPKPFPLASTSNEAICTNLSRDQKLSVFDSNATEHKQETNAISIREQTRYTQNSDVLDISLLLTPPIETVIKAKVKNAGTMHCRHRSTVNTTNTIIDLSAKPLEDSKPQETETSQVGILQKESNTQSSPLQNDNRRYGWSEGQQYREASSPGSNSGRSGQRGFKDVCLHCSSEELVKMLECGLTLCSYCVVYKHAHCWVCSKKIQNKGLQGTISVSELTLSLQGHSRDSTLKITYHIPDGIQGVRIRRAMR